MAGYAEPLSNLEPQIGMLTRANGRRWTAVRGWSIARRFLFVLGVIYIAKQLIYLLVFPPFTGHDEVAHYSYIRSVAEDGRIPVLLEDYLPAELAGYCDRALGWCGRPIDRGPQYAANHPPLYYVLLTPAYWWSDGWTPEEQQYLFRVMAIPFGLATVVLAYLLARTLFPTDQFLAITVPAFVAFQPQVSYEAAIVNNDIVGVAFYSLILLLLVIGLRDRFPTRNCLLIGFTLGLALLSKGTALTALPLIGLALAVSLPRPWLMPRLWLRKVVQISVPALLLTAPWYVFLYRTYGNFSGLDQVEELQQMFNHPEGNFFELLFSQDFITSRFHETWGLFGWRLIPLSTTTLWVIAVPLIVAFGGLIQYTALIFRRAERDKASGDPVFLLRYWQARALLLVFAACAIGYLAVVQFGTRFQLTQARYYFPVINAGALLTMLGARTLIPRRFFGYAQAAIFGSMVMLTIAIFSQFVIPFWHPPVA